MTSKSASCRRKVHHDVEKCIMTSTSASKHQQVCNDVENVCHKEQNVYHNIKRFVMK